MFANFSTNKVNATTSQTKIDKSVFNGKNQINLNDKFFMSSAKIRECIKSIKPKKCEGYDRFPPELKEFTIKNHNSTMVNSKGHPNSKKGP